jgi:hypothetical protein
MAAVVPKQTVGVAVLVRDEQIQIAVAVDVEPHGADGPARIADARFNGDVGEAAVVVAKQPVRLVAECHKEVEIAIVVVVDPRRLPRNADEMEAECRRHVGEMAAVAVVSIQLVGDAAGKADVQIEVTVAVEVAPCRDARLDRVRKADGRRHIFESSVVLLVQTVRAAAEADELVEIAVVVEVGPGISLAATGGKEIRLDKRKPRRYLGSAERSDGEHRQ